MGKEPSESIKLSGIAATNKLSEIYEVASGI
jgi:hypothetical protein